MARLSWPGWPVIYWDRLSGTWDWTPDTVTHLSTNRARRRLTSLIETNALTTTPNRQPVKVKKLSKTNSIYYWCKLDTLLSKPLLVMVCCVKFRSASFFVAAYCCIEVPIVVICAVRLFLYNCSRSCEFDGVFAVRVRRSYVRRYTVVYTSLSWHSSRWICICWWLFAGASSCCSSVVHSRP